MANEKNIKDYLHLYLGCDCQRMGEVDENGKPLKATLTGVSYDDTQRRWWAYFENNETGYSLVEDVFPILRPLSDLTEEETKEYEATRQFVRATPVHQIGNMQWTPETFRYLLFKHFDLFNLIESGLAIDRTTFKIIQHGRK